MCPFAEDAASRLTSKPLPIPAPFNLPPPSLMRLKLFTMLLTTLPPAISASCLTDAGVAPTSFIPFPWNTPSSSSYLALPACLSLPPAHHLIYLGLTMIPSLETVTRFNDLRVARRLAPVCACVCACVCVRVCVIYTRARLVCIHISHTHTWCVYIYIHVFVCMCVCVCM